MTRRQRVKAPPNQLRRENMNSDEWFTWLLFVAWITIIVAFIAEIVGVI
jgi:hypothetical protein